MSTVMLHLARGATEVATTIDPVTAQAVPHENRRMAARAERRTVDEDAIDVDILLNRMSGPASRALQTPLGQVDVLGPIRRGHDRLCPRFIKERQMREMAHQGC